MASSRGGLESRTEGDGTVNEGGVGSHVVVGLAKLAVVSLRVSHVFYLLRGEVDLKYPHCLWSYVICSRATYT